VKEKRIDGNETLLARRKKGKTTNEAAMMSNIEMSIPIR
jgi:hypothetical protein